MHLLDYPRGNYRFLTGIAPYSAGIVAQPGYEVVRTTLHQPLPYREGFALIDRHLAALGRPSQALCAIELRLPQPLSFQGFIDFNVGYRACLAEREILIGEHNPVARTNVAPAVAPPAEPSLYAFSYTVPTAHTTAWPTFIVAGAGDLRDQAILAREAVVRPGETSPDALRAKAACVMQVMQARLTGLGLTWAEVTAVDIYTVYDLHSFLLGEILAPIDTAAIHGVHWVYSHPPIADLAFEMDLRGLRTELRLP
jgi:hypothetical protein